MRLKLTMNNIIRRLIKEQKMNQTTLAKALGFKGQSNVAERLRADMRMSTAVSMLDVLGYDVYVVERKPGKNVAFAKEDGLKVALKEED